MGGLSIESPEFHKGTKMEAPNVHPSFPQPDDPSQAIWRYMDASKFDWLLNEQRLFMPTADNLGDPREGSTPPGQIAKWERDAEEAATEEARKVLEHNRSFFAEFSKLFRPRYYVSCWHMNAHENYSMWRCYTKNTEAVAIKTRYKTLRSLTPHMVYMGIIRYIDYSTDSLPWGNMFEYIMHKDTYYRFEAEVRLVATPPVNEENGLKEFSADHFVLAANPDFRIYAPKVDPSKLIEAIVIHPEASDAFAESIRKRCAKAGLPDPEMSRGTAKPVY
jgi:hypothetical protein